MGKAGRISRSPKSLGNGLADGKLHDLPICDVSTSVSFEMKADI